LEDCWFNIQALVASQLSACGVDINNIIEMQIFVFFTKLYKLTFLPVCLYMAFIDYQHKHES
jgi:hypothetical protein